MGKPPPHLHICYVYVIINTLQAPVKQAKTKQKLAKVDLNNKLCLQSKTGNAHIKRNYRNRIGRGNVLTHKTYKLTTESHNGIPLSTDSNVLQNVLQNEGITVLTEILYLCFICFMT